MKKTNHILITKYFYIAIVLILQLNCGTVVNNPGDEEERSPENKPDDTIAGGAKSAPESGTPQSATPPIKGPTEFSPILQDSLTVCATPTWAGVVPDSITQSPQETIEVALNTVQKEAKITFVAYTSERVKINSLPFMLAPGTSFFLLQMTNEVPSCYVKLSVPEREAGIGSKKWTISFP